MNSNLADIKKYSLLFSIIFLSLFVSLRLETGLVLIRPFDLLCLISLPSVLLLKKSTGEKICKGFFYLLPFYIIHILSSSTIGVNNFIRETLQVTVLIFFAFSLSIFKTRIDLLKTFNYIFLGSLIITLGIVYYHYDIGIIGRGWKELSDSKTIFTIITILTFVYFAFIKKTKNYELIILLFILLPLLLLSGERKALLIFGLLFLIKYSPGFTIKTFFILFSMFLFLNILNNFIENSYIHQKINTMLNFMQTGNVEYFLDTGDINPNDTISNLQRAFSFKVSIDYILSNPFFGIGTNNYVKMVVEQYPRIASFRTGALVHGIHGEFQRIIVENGLVGLIAYCMIWYKSWTRSKITLNKVEKSGIINKDQLNLCLYGIYLSLAFYVGTEASSTRSFIFLTIISLLPDYYNYHFGLKKNNLKK